jgi:peptide/nickel transport system substrate-binding protein
MSTRRTLIHTALAAALTLGIGLAAPSAVMAQGKTIKVANQGDALSLDPHSLNESLQLSLLGNVYEPLIGRGKKLELVPALATEWTQVNPTTWRFKLRPNVKFHDGTPFTADDVIFSWKRAAGDGSDMKSYVGSIRDVRRVDDLTVEIVTNEPFPILPDVVTNWYMMSRKWAEENKAVQPVDKRKGVENTASFKANGTGPYRVRSREPGVRTVLQRNPGWWGKPEGNVEEVIFTPIANASTRVAALLSGEIDVMEPVPVQDVARVAAGANTKVMQGPELRTIFLGMDQARPELLFSNVKGKNPFKDKRVRQAVYQAIDVDAIQKAVMRGASTPTALMIAPGITGFPADLNKRLPYDPAASRKLLAEAGYPSGFEVGMNCPNDRYVNDEAICKAVSAMLANVGIKVNLASETKGTYFPKILSRNTSFYLLGWTPGTYDSHNPLYSLMATPKGPVGSFNLGSYSNARLDELTDAIAKETDQTKRNAMIREAMKLHQDEVGHIPLHQQALAWGMKKNVELVQLPDNYLFFKWVTVK